MGVGGGSDIDRLAVRDARWERERPRLFFTHAMARLAREPCRKALLEDLQFPDVPERIYAAVFAGEAKQQASDRPADALINLGAVNL